MPSPLPDLIPARILNEHVYCRRLAYLEWVDQQFTDNAYTADGSFVHRNVDRERSKPPVPRDDRDDDDQTYQEAAEPPPSTAVTVSSQRLGLIAKIDLLEAKNGTVVPVEYKRGSPQSQNSPLWEPELIQLCAQTLILRDAGYTVPHAEAYFAQTRTRHTIEITDDLAAKTTAAIVQLRRDAAGDHPPPPLVDSPKCPRCSLVGICLPDEVHALSVDDGKTPRRLIAGDPSSTPLYAATQGSRLTKRGERAILIEDGKQAASRRLIDVSHIAVLGNVDVASPLLRACFDAGIPVLWFTAGGWFKGFATGMPAKNVAVRMRQHRAAALGSPEFAAAFVAGKIKNCRTLLRRHLRNDSGKVLAQLANLAKSAEKERSMESLLGIEGTAARLYFSHFGALLKQSPKAFSFEERNRRPPRDPVNALLSFFYALLIKDVTAAVLAAGLDPHVGLYHRPGFGRPALALDLAEEFRPLIGDSTVMMAINNGELTSSDFISRAGGVSLTDKGRRKAIASYERRMTTELTHPIFRYKSSYRRSLEIQARLLAAVLAGDVPTYRSLTTR